MSVRTVQLQLQFDSSFRLRGKGGTRRRVAGRRPGRAAPGRRPRPMPGGPQARQRHARRTCTQFLGLRSSCSCFGSWLPFLPSLASSTAAAGFCSSGTTRVAGRDWRAADSVLFAAAGESGRAPYVGGLAADGSRERPTASTGWAPVRSSSVRCHTHWPAALVAAPWSPASAASPGHLYGTAQTLRRLGTTLRRGCW